jgi:ribosomal protein L15
VGKCQFIEDFLKEVFQMHHFKKEYAVINLERIAEKFDSGEVSRETLLEKGLLSGRFKSLPIKILAKGEFNKSLTFKGIAKFSKSASRSNY